MVDSEAIKKANALVEAMSYIQRFHNKVVVVKVGGSIMDDEYALSNILNDIVFMNYVGMQPVLVHGGGKAINQAMDKAGLQPQWIQGRRYTDDRTLAIAEHVLCNQINRFIVNFIQSQGCEAMGLHSLSSVVLFAEKTYLDGADGRRIDLGQVGDVKDVNARLLKLLVQADSIPVIATIARDQAGSKLNVNADTAAGAVAAAMKAEKLVVVSDTHGIRTNKDDPESRVSHLTVSQIDEMVKSGVISAGMLPKVQACAQPWKAEPPKPTSLMVVSPMPCCWKFTPKRELALRSSCKSGRILLSQWHDDPVAAAPGLV